MSTKSAEVNSKLVGPFRAEDFQRSIDIYGDLGRVDWEVVAEDAAARLAPLWEALERWKGAEDVLKVACFDGTDDFGLRDLQAHMTIAGEQVLTAYRALRDREGK